MLATSSSEAYQIKSKPKQLVNRSDLIFINDRVVVSAGKICSWTKKEGTTYFKHNIKNNLFLHHSTILNENLDRETFIFKYLTFLLVPYSYALKNQIRAILQFPYDLLDLRANQLNVRTLCLRNLFWS
jgi:hypothetical protein